MKKVLNKIKNDPFLLIILLIYIIVWMSIPIFIKSNILRYLSRLTFTLIVVYLSFRRESKRN